MSAINPDTNNEATCCFCLDDFQSDQKISGHASVINNNFNAHLIHTDCQALWNKDICPLCMQTSQETQTTSKIELSRGIFKIELYRGILFSDHLQKQEMYRGLLTNNEERFQTALRHANASDPALLHYAVQNNRDSFVHMLLNQDLSAENKEMRLSKEARFTALEAAIGSGNQNLVQAFLTHNEEILAHPDRYEASQTAFDQSQKNLLELTAKSTNNQTMIQLLSSMKTFTSPAQSLGAVLSPAANPVAVAHREIDWSYLYNRSTEPEIDNPYKGSYCE